MKFDLKLLVSILCLVVGLSSSIVFFFWIDNELSFDKFNKDGENIYRLVSTEKNSGIKSPKAVCRLYKDLPAKYPQITDGVNIMIYNNRNESPYYISRDDSEEVFFVTSIVSTDNFFSFFSYPVCEGQENIKLLPGQIAVSRKIAERLFGNEPAVGKSVNVALMGEKEKMEIVLVADVPSNTHLPFDIVIPATSFELQVADDVRYMGSVYIKMRPDKKISSSEAKDLVLYQMTNYDQQYMLSFQPLFDIHLHTDFDDVSSTNNGKASNVWIITIGLVLILTVMIVNFVTLHVSNNIKNTKDMAVRKIFGGSDISIFFESAKKTFLPVALAMFFSVFVVWAIMPTVESLTGVEINIKRGWSIVIFLLAMLVVLPVSSASFQYYCLRSSELSELIKSRMRFIKGIRLSNKISAFQVAVSAFLAVFTFTVLSQISFMLKHDDGIDTTSIVSINSCNIRSYDIDVIKDALNKNPDIVGVGLCEGDIKNIRRVTSNVTWDGKEKDTDIPFYCWTTDADFMKMVGLQLIDGRFLDENLNVDDYFDGTYIGHAEFVVNESAVLSMGFNINEAVGKKINVGGDDGTIVGVIKDFNFRNLHDAITPLVIYYCPESLPNVMVKIRPEKSEQTLEFIRETVMPYLLTPMLDCHFVDDVVAYAQEYQMGSLSTIFFVASLLLSLIGFASVISYHINQETPNIAIRKVYGATLGQIIAYYTQKELRLYLLLTFFTAGISCEISVRWLSNFAYHIGEWSVVLIGIGTVVAFLALLTLIVSAYVNAATRKRIVDVVQK